MAIAKHLNLLPPYYHPTTICFIDDNYGFLQSLVLDLPLDWCCATYLSPEAALADINTPHPQSPLVDRCFSMHTNADGNPVIQLDFAVLEQEMRHLERFSRISVLVVDYAMPTMDGLELCAAVADPYVKKILLTGVATEKTAVAAFNDGVIDRYIPKARLTHPSRVMPYVEELQREYFAQYSAQLSVNLALAPPAFMTEPLVRQYFFESLKQLKIVEYYMVTDPYGYLLVKRNGKMFRAVFQNATEHMSQTAAAQALGAPDSQLEQLKSGHALLYLYEHPDDYLGNEQFPWDEFVLPATMIKGLQNWYIAFLEDPPIDIDFEPQKSSFQSYLDNRDRSL